MELIRNICCFYKMLKININPKRMIIPIYILFSLDVFDIIKKLLNNNDILYKSKYRMSEYVNHYFGFSATARREN